MLLSVVIQSYGVELHQPEREKLLFLSLRAWENLISCQNQITTALQAKEECSVKLNEVDDIRVHTSVFQEKVYVHIRIWWQNRPTKNGVALTPADWDKVRSYMVQSGEMTLGIEVMKRLVLKKVRDCEGCKKGWASQRDHTCLMQTEVLPEEFIQALAKDAYKKGLILETPHDTFRRIKLFHVKELEDETAEDC